MDVSLRVFSSSRIAVAGLVLAGVTKALGGRVVIDGVDLTVGEGEMVCLLGPSGCGKTTTLRLVAGFLYPDSGRVLIDSVDVTETPPEKRPTAMVFQNYALWPHMNVFSNVAFGLRLRKLSKEEVRSRCEEVLRMVNMWDLRDRRPAQISGGEQQRVALARALVLRPKLLLLDEPLSNLDAKLRVQVRDEIREIQQRVGITSVFVTHDQDEALSISDRVAIMAEGRVEQVGSPDDVYRLPRTTFVAGFVGIVNRFRGRISGEGVHLASGPGPVPFAEENSKRLASEVAGEWDIIVRPEDVIVEPGVRSPNGGSPVVLVREVRRGHFKECIFGFCGASLGREQGMDALRIRAFLPAGGDVGARASIKFRRVLLYREGLLAHEVGSSEAGRSEGAPVGRTGW